jgi:hypothetical protein
MHEVTIWKATVYVRNGRFDRFDGQGEQSFKTNEPFTIEMPTGNFLEAAVQNDSVVLYFAVQPGKPVTKWTGKLVMTGQSFDVAGWGYWNTLLLDGGSFVLHLYEKYEDRGQPEATETKP